MDYIIKNYNQFGETALTLVINYEEKTIKLYYGQTAPRGKDKKATKKAINELYNNLKIAGFEDLTDK